MISGLFGGLHILPNQPPNYNTLLFTMSINASAKFPASIKMLSSCFSNTYDYVVSAAAQLLAQVSIPSGVAWST